jgi:hypothetical protein
MLINKLNFNQPFKYFILTGNSVYISFVSFEINGIIVQREKMDQRIQAFNPPARVSRNIGMAS